MCYAAFNFCFQIQLAPLQRGGAAGGAGGRAVADQGKALQVDPIKPTLKPTGTKRLKLKYDIKPTLKPTGTKRLKLKYDIKPTLKPTGTKRLKLKYDILLSNFAFKFNLRRYTKEEEERRRKDLAAAVEHERGEMEAGAYSRPLSSST